MIGPPLLCFGSWMTHQRSEHCPQQHFVLSSRTAQYRQTKMATDRLEITCCTKTNRLHSPVELTYSRIDPHKSTYGCGLYLRSQHYPREPQIIASSCLICKSDRDVKIFGKLADRQGTFNPQTPFFKLSRPGTLPPCSTATRRP